MNVAPVKSNMSKLEQSALVKLTETLDSWISLTSDEKKQNFDTAADQFYSVIKVYFVASIAENPQCRKLAISRTPDILKAIPKIFNASPASKVDLQDLIKSSSGDLLKTMSPNSEDWLHPWLVLVHCLRVSSAIKPVTINSILKLPEQAFKMAKVNPKCCQVAFNAWRQLIVLLPQLPKLLPSKAVSILLTPLKVAFHPSCNSAVLETWVALLEEVGRNDFLHDLIGNILSVFNNSIQNVKCNPEDLCSLEACLLKLASDPVLAYNCDTSIIDSLVYVSSNCQWNDLVAESWASFIDSLSQEVIEIQAAIVKLSLIGESTKLPSVEVRHQMLLAILAKSAFCLDAPLFPYLLSDLSSIFVPLMHLAEFREKIFFPLLVYIKSHSKEIAGSSSKIIEFWLNMTLILEEYLKTVDKDLSKIDVDIITVSLTMPLFFPSQLWKDDFLENIKKIALYVKWTDPIRKSVAGTLEEVVRDSPLNLGHALRLVSNITVFDSDFDVNNVLTAASRKIVGTKVEVILDYLNLLEGVVNKRPLDLARGTLRPSLSLLLRMASSYPSPFDSQIKEMASKLLPRLSSINGSTPQPEEAALRSPQTQSHIMAQSNFLHRLSKAEEKHGKRGMAASSLFGTHPNEDRRSPGDKENESKVSTNINLAVGNTSDSSSSDQEWASAKLASSVRVSSDFHRTDRSPRAARTPRSKVLASNSPPTTKQPMTPQPPPVEDLSLQDFVFIAPKEKKATPLTEHQKEKMRSRRSDIPALYQDLSQDISSQDLSSQDSVHFNQVKTEPVCVTEEAVAGDAVLPDDVSADSPKQSSQELTFSNRITPNKVAADDTSKHAQKDVISVKKDDSVAPSVTENQEPKISEPTSGKVAKKTRRSTFKDKTTDKSEETEELPKDDRSVSSRKTSDDTVDELSPSEDDDEHSEKEEEKGDDQVFGKTPRSNSARKLDFNNSEIRRSSRNSRSVFKRQGVSINVIGLKRKYTKKSSTVGKANTNGEDNSDSEYTKQTGGGENISENQTVEKSSISDSDKSNKLADSSSDKVEDVVKRKKSIDPKNKPIETNPAAVGVTDEEREKDEQSVCKKRKSIGPKGKNKLENTKLAVNNDEAQQVPDECDESEDIVVKKRKSDLKDEDKHIKITLDLSGMISPKKADETVHQSIAPEVKDRTPNICPDASKRFEDTEEFVTETKNSTSDVTMNKNLKRKLDSSFSNTKQVRRKMLRSVEKKKQEECSLESEVLETPVTAVEASDDLKGNSSENADPSGENEADKGVVCESTETKRSENLGINVEGINMHLLKEAKVLIAKGAVERKLVMVKRINPVPVDDANKIDECQDKEDTEVSVSDLMTPSNVKGIPETDISKSPEKKPANPNNRLRRRKTLSPSRFNKLSSKMFRRKSMGDLSQKKEIDRDMDKRLTQRKGTDGDFDKSPPPTEEIDADIEVQKNGVEVLQGNPEMAEDVEKEIEVIQSEELEAGKNERKRSSGSLDSWLIRRSAPSPPPQDESTAEFHSSFSLLTSPIIDEVIESSQETPTAVLPLSPKSTPVPSTPEAQNEYKDVVTDGKSAPDNVTSSPGPSSPMLIKRGDSRERRARRQTQVFRPSIKALLGDNQDNPRCSPRNWPTGEMEPWVPCCPTPPDVGSVTPILKRNPTPTISDSPSSTPCKKRVRFVDPVITRGLYYNEKESSGHIQHPATPVPRMIQNSGRNQVANLKELDVESQSHDGDDDEKVMNYESGTEPNDNMEEDEGADTSLVAFALPNSEDEVPGEAVSNEGITKEASTPQVMKEAEPIPTSVEIERMDSTSAEECEDADHNEAQERSDSEETPQNQIGDSQDVTDNNVDNLEKLATDDFSKSPEKDSSPTQTALTILRGDLKKKVVVEPLPNEFDVKSEPLLFSASWQNIDEVESHVDLVLATCQSPTKADDVGSGAMETSDSNILTVIHSVSKQQSVDGESITTIKEEARSNSSTARDIAQDVSIGTNTLTTPQVVDIRSVKQEVTSPVRVSSYVKPQVIITKVNVNHSSVRNTEDDPIKHFVNSFIQSGYSTNKVPNTTLLNAAACMTTIVSQRLANK